MLNSAQTDWKFYYCSLYLKGKYHSLVPRPTLFFVLQFASVYYTECKPKNKKRGRPGNEARSITWCCRTSSGVWALWVICEGWCLSGLKCDKWYCKRGTLCNTLMGLDHAFCFVPFYLTKGNRKSIVAIGSLLELQDVSCNCIQLTNSPHCPLFTLHRCYNECIASWQPFMEFNKPQQDAKSRSVLHVTVIS